ncbi:MAG: DMT family transporter [Bacteroidales bacterium]|nr:DMT family transporter [Bacteroidales bacterium]
MKTNQKKAYIFAISAVLLWSTVAVSFKIALRYVDFLHLLLFASFTALIIYLIIALIDKTFKQLFKISKKDILTSALIGFLNPFLYYVVLFKAYSLLPAQIAQPLNYLWPVVLVLLSAPLLGEKLKLISVVSLLVGFVGVYVISTQGDLFGFKVNEPLGVLLAAGSSVIWALSWIFNQKDKRNEQTKLFWNFLFGFFYIFISVVLFSELKLPEIKGIAAVIYVGFFEMGITFFLWMKALHLTERNDNISNLIFLSPFSALIFIHFILKEEIYYTTLIGLVLIVAGIFIQRIRFKSKK